jgi:hypothetical protein
MIEKIAIIATAIALAAGAVYLVSPYHNCVRTISSAPDRNATQAVAFCSGRDRSIPW